MCFEFKDRLASGEIRDVKVHISPIEIKDRTFFFFDQPRHQPAQDPDGRTVSLGPVGGVGDGGAREINNPIQGILNHAGLIEGHPERSERNLDIARRIKDESVRIAKITQNLLFYSKDSRVDKKLVDVGKRSRPLFL